MLRHTICSALTLAVVAVIAALAVGRPHLNIRELVSSADVIVIADVGESIASGPSAPMNIAGRLVPARQYSTKLLAKTAIKGTCANELTVTYALPLQFMGYIPLRSGVRTVFLRKKGNVYEPANPYFPDLPASDTLVQTNGATNTDKVATLILHSLADVIASSTAPVSDKLEVLQIDYAIPADSYFVSALKQGIASAPTQSVKEALQAELLIRGDVSELAQVVEAIRNHTASTDQRPKLLYAIATWVKDPTAAPAISSLLSSSDPETRVAAAKALWHIADSRTTNALVASLNDSNDEVRYYAVRALADITHQNSWAPSVSEFKEHEQHYLQHWKDWATANRSDKTD